MTCREHEHGGRCRLLVKTQGNGLRQEDGPYAAAPERRLHNSRPTSPDDISTNVAGSGLTIVELTVAELTFVNETMRSL